MHREWLVAVFAFSLTICTPTISYGQVDFNECGVFEIDFNFCTYFVPDSGLFNRVEVDALNPPIGQLVRVTGTSFSCAGICFPDICVSNGVLVFDCPGSQPAETNCSNGQDDDSDGLIDCCDPDCGCTPGAEICDNGFDDDCDGLVDLQDSDCAGSPSGGVFIRGDANGDGSINIADAIKSLGFLFLNDSVDCLDSADVGDDGAIDIADPIALLTELFVSGSSPPPPPPYPDCGFDPTTDDNHCWDYFVCP